MDDRLRDSRFTPWPNGRFMERFGPLGRDAPHSDKKLCLVATDARLLVDLLHGLSLRPDCFYVKYSTFTRDGMLLGRCFLRDDRAVAELCQELKGHPHLMVSVQDDAFFSPYREARVPGGAIGVWDEGPEDGADVRRVHEQAFGRPDEAGMVEQVRAAGAAVISLAASLVPEDRKHARLEAVGHVLLSPVTADHSADPPGLGLAPLAVLPSYQRRGVGARLTEAALRRARLLGHAYVVVVGDPAYYARFGFRPASHFGLRYEADVPDEAFMALPLREGSLDGVHGVVRYFRAFAQG